jgi:hypothetical protein
MRALNSEFEALANAERLAGYALTPVEQDDGSAPATFSADLPSARALVLAGPAVNAKSAAAKAMSSATSVTGWIKGRMPMIGRPA